MRGLPAQPGILALILALLPLDADAWTHVARAGETLEQLAARYYGDPGRATVIRAANGFVHPDDGRLVEGEAVFIPEVTYIRVQEGDSWESLANRFLSSPRRAGYLAEMNDLSQKQMPPVGAVVKVPFHLRHIFAKGESLKTVVKLYYANERSTEWLRKYNAPEKRKYGRGEVIIVPLIHLDFAPSEQDTVDAFRANRSSKEEMARQEATRARILQLKADFEKGRYVAMVSVASELIGYGRLTVPQEIGIYNYLAYAYIALGETELAVSAFCQALARQPEMELSAITTSPKIVAAFNKAKETVARKLSASAGAADGRSAQPAN